MKNLFDQLFLRLLESFHEEVARPRNGLTTVSETKVIEILIEIEAHFGQLGRR